LQHPVVQESSSQQGCPTPPQAPHLAFEQPRPPAVHRSKGGQHACPEPPHVPHEPAEHVPLPLAAPHAVPEARHVPESQHPPELQAPCAQHGWSAPPQARQVSS
jgi:hypothetical protein